MPIVPIKRSSQASPHQAEKRDFSHVSPRARVRPEPAGPPPAASQQRQHHKVDRSGPNWDENGNYIIGKGRPPVKPQWKKGQSGNPQGPKPKEKLDPLAAFDKELLAPFEATVNGKLQWLTNLTLALQALKSEAAKGTVKAADIILKHCFAAIDRTVAREGTPEIEVWEQQAIDQILDQLGLPARPVVRDTDRLHGKDNLE